MIHNHIHIYTSYHRSAASLAANAGLSLPQLKALTGHKSDAVAQRYIDTCDAMKMVGAKGTAIQV
jgi:hypothetical protein